MSLGSSDMVGSALGTAFSLLFLASFIQGLQDFQVFHLEKVEALVGQDVELPCIIKDSPDLHIVSTEWSKNRSATIKLGLYNPKRGIHYFRPSISIVSESMGSSLHLSSVTKLDSDIYICDITTFPWGSIRRETELQIKDADDLCDVNGTAEVYAGENLTIKCSKLLNARYRWTMNKKLVSESESLELLWVTAAHSGLYTLTVITQNKTLDKEFIITVLTGATSLRTELPTVSPQFDATDMDLTETKDSSFTTSIATGLSTTDTNATRDISVGTDVTHVNAMPSNLSITAAEHITSYTNNFSVTSSPATQSDPHTFNNSSDQEINPTHPLSTTTSDQSEPSSFSTTLSYGSPMFRSTQEKGNESMLHTARPKVNSSTRPEESRTLGHITENNPSATATSTDIHPKDTDGVQSYLLLVLIIIPVLVLIAVAGILYRREIIKQRMALPPPFKPPPPPVKYASARYSEVSTQPFPTSRCNSIVGPEDMKQMFIHI